MLTKFVYHIQPKTEKTMFLLITLINLRSLLKTLAFIYISPIIIKLDCIFYYLYYIKFIITFLTLKLGVE